MALFNILNTAKLALFNFSYGADYPFMPPRQLQIALTNRCNLACKMCFVNRYRTKEEEEMSPDELKKILIQARSVFGIKQLVLTGGEPLLVADKVCAAANLARSLKMSTLITTNGFYLKEYAKRLVDSGVTHFHVSLDGLKSVHNSLRNSDEVFDRAKDAIRELASLRSEGSSFSIGIGALILKNTINDFSGLFELGDALGADVFDLLVYTPDITDFSVKNKDEFWLSADDVKRLDRAYSALKAAKTKRIRLNPLFRIDLVKKYYLGTLTQNDWRCFAGYKNMFVTMSDPKRQGSFEPCIFMCKAHIPVRENGYDLRKIWFSKEAHIARRTIRKCRSYCYQHCFSLPDPGYALFNKVYF